MTEKVIAGKKKKQINAFSPSSALCNVQDWVIIKVLSGWKWFV